MKKISGDECFTTLDNDGFLLYYFSASWCKPCQSILNDIINLSNIYTGKVRFFKVDIDDDDNNEICEKCGIVSVPSFLLFKDREYINRIVGANIETIIQFINKNCNIIVEKNNLNKE
tara:strand:+ start:3961 stop:4311 length:351 start_codon:yes stop_codon:yes gene_type:complete